MSVVRVTGTGVWFVMLRRFPSVQQAAIGYRLSFGPFIPFHQNGLAPPEVDVGRRQVANALVISQVIIVGDEGLDLGFEIAWQVIDFLIWGNGGIRRRSVTAFR
jgi:hypothetical protein